MKIKSVMSKLKKKSTVSPRVEKVGYYVRIGITLLIISAVTATLLAFVNALTEDRIDENELAVMEEALGNIFRDCDGLRAVEGKYDEPVIAAYEVYSGGKKIGYGIQVAPVGFKEEIGMIVGANISGECVGVEITSISDTPGVGTKVKENSFLAGLAGLNAENISEFDIISGATISSSAVKEGVAAALELEIFGDGQMIEETDIQPSETTGGIETPQDSITENQPQTPVEQIPGDTVA